jgi:hypothetical protein
MCKAHSAVRYRVKKEEINSGVVRRTAWIVKRVLMWCGNMSGTELTYSDILVIMLIGVGKFWAEKC